MKGEDLLQGLNYVDNTMIAEAETAIPVHHRKRGPMVLLVAALISLLGVVAFASTMPANPNGWFYSFFGTAEQAAAEAELRMHALI